MTGLWVQKLADLGWSQAELAARVGCKSSVVTNWKQRGCPVSVGRLLEIYLDAMLAMQGLEDELRGLSRMRPRNARGRHDPLRRALSAEELARRA